VHENWVSGVSLSCPVEEAPTCPRFLADAYFAERGILIEGVVTDTAYLGQPPVLPNLPGRANPGRHALLLVRLLIG